MKTQLLSLTLLFLLVLSCGQQDNEKPERIPEPHKKDTAESIYVQALNHYFVMDSLLNDPTMDSLLNSLESELDEPEDIENEMKQMLRKDIIEDNLPENFDSLIKVDTIMARLYREVKKELE